MISHSVRIFNFSLQGISLFFETLSFVGEINGLLVVVGIGIIVVI